MKILFDAREQTRNITGIGTYVRSLTREIKAMHKAGIECRCLPEDADPPKQGGARSRKTQVANLVRNLSWKQVALPLLAKREKADVLVCMDPIGPLMSPVPTALIVYDLIFMTTEAQTGAWTRYWRVLVPRCARRADWIFTPSRETKRKIMDILEVPEEKIVLFRSGVGAHFRPLGLSPEAAERKRREMGLPGSYFLTVGAHDARRNLITLLDAFRLLKQRGAFPHKLLIIGPRTPHSREIVQHVNDLGLHRDVLLMDALSNEELPPYYGLADLYLYPSLEEGFGLTPLEAMACGCPVITSQVSSLPEVVGKAAMLVDPRDPKALAGSIEQVLSDEALRKNLVQMGIERAKGFSWHAGAEEIVKSCVERVRNAQAGSLP